MTNGSYLFSTLFLKRNNWTTDYLTGNWQENNKLFIKALYGFVSFMSTTSTALFSLSNLHTSLSNLHTFLSQTCIPEYFYEGSRKEEVGSACSELTAGKLSIDRIKKRMREEQGLHVGWEEKKTRPFYYSLPCPSPPKNCKMCPSLHSCDEDFPPSVPVGDDGDDHLTMIRDSSRGTGISLRIRRFV